MGVAVYRESVVEEGKGLYGETINRIRRPLNRQSKRHAKAVACALAKGEQPSLVDVKLDYSLLSEWKHVKNEILKPDVWFYDPYHDQNLFWALGLSWTNDVLNKHGNKVDPKVLLDLIHGLKPDVSKYKGSEKAWEDYFKTRKEQLVSLLNKAVENNEQVVVTKQDAEEVLL
jgi:hypothetical protein